MNLDSILSLGFVEYKKKDSPYDIEAWFKSYSKDGFVIHQNIVSEKFEFHYIGLDSILGYQIRRIADLEDLKNLHYAIRGEELVKEERKGVK